MSESYTTTNAGAAAPSDELPLTLGPDGPILLQDSYLIEQMAAFNRERCLSVSRTPKGLVHMGVSK